MADRFNEKADRAAFLAEEFAGACRSCPPEFSRVAFGNLARSFRAAAAAAARAGRSAKAGVFLAKASLAAATSRKAERLAPRLAKLKLAA